MNYCILIGNVGKDLELKATQSNISYCQFSLAVQRPFKNEDGESETDWFSVVVWRKLAENLVKYQGKGSKIAVQGRLSTRSYETENGNRYITEIVADNIEYLSTKDTYPQTDEEIDETYKDNPYNPTITTPTSRRQERAKENVSGGVASAEDLPF
jgi:single-strand DNA-binding protein